MGATGPYGMAKRLLHEACETYGRQYDLPCAVLDTRCKECVFNNPEDASKWIPSDKAYEPVGATVLARGFDQYYHT